MRNHNGPGDDDDDNDSSIWNAWNTAGSDTQVASEDSYGDNQSFESSSAFGSSDMGTSNNWASSSSSDW